MPSMTQEQAASIILEWDVIPAALLSGDHKAVLAAAKEVNRDYAKRAMNEFLNHESSRKFVAKVAKPDITHADEKNTKVTTINELHD